MMAIERRFIPMLGLLLLVAGLTGPVMAQNKTALKQQAQALRASAAPIHPNQQILDVNNMTTWVENTGAFPWIDGFSGLNGSFPKGTTGAVFAQGLVWGGIVRDGATPEVRVNGSTYATGLQPGRVLRNPDGSVIGPGDAGDVASYHVWRVRRNWESLDFNEAASQFYGVAPGSVSEEQRQTVRDQYEYDWENWPAEWGAPYEDVDGNGSYNPDVDIPGYPGADQTLWLVANDLGSGVSETSYGSPAIGLEYQLTLWGYDFPQTSPLGNITFAQARLIYTGTENTPANARIDSMYVVQWADPDVGTYSDDFAGVDTTLSLGYAYNANTRDATYASYGLAPAAVGWDFLQGPLNAEGDTLDMTAFVYFAAGSDISDPDLGEYSGTLQWYNLMRGLRPRPEYPAGDPFVNPLTTEPSVFTLTGDPVSGAGWIDGQQLPPGDRRIVQSTGPFTMELGDTVDVVVGQVGALGSSNLSSVTVLKYHDQFAQFAYDNDFQLPSPPSVPPVEVSERDGEIVIDWGSDLDAVRAIESSENVGFAFEGYNVYQLPSRTASLSSAVKVVTYDKANLISTVFDNVVDEETGFVIQRPVQTAPNEGLKRYEVITRDHIRSRPLANGVEYHFAVTTYSVLQGDVEDAPFRILESTPVVLSVTPQPPRPGETTVTPSGTSLAVEQVAGTGDVNVTATAVNPDRLVDASWTVTVDSSDGGSWDLLRDGSAVLTDQPYGVSTEIPMVNGLLVNVSDLTFSKPVTILDDFAVEDEGGDLHLWGDGTLFGNPNGYYSTFYGGDEPAVEDLMPDLEFRFTGNGAMEEPTTEGGQLATYWERATFAQTDVSGLANSTIRMPFELWDVENDRQVNFAVIGRNADAESPWGDGVGEYYRMSARDYIIPIMTEYDEAAVQSDGTSPLDPKATWTLFFVEGGSSVWETGDVYRVRFANPAVSGLDEFAFETDAIQTGVEDSIRASVDDINVFPNPYLGFSQLEASRYQKFVTFTHLPPNATIRIFNLAGTMVRRIDHEGPGQFAEWDLQNQDGIPVASGVYLVHVETDYGDKTLKVALVQEGQILEQY